MAKKRLIIYFILVVAILLIFLPGFSRYQKLLAEQRELQTRIADLEAANARLEEEKEKLQTDVEYIEERARDILGVVKENEIPYKIIDGEGGEE